MRHLTEVALCSVGVGFGLVSLALGPLGGLHAYAAGVCLVLARQARR